MLKLNFSVNKSNRVRRFRDWSRATNKKWKAEGILPSSFKASVWAERSKETSEHCEVMRASEFSAIISFNLLTHKGYIGRLSGISNSAGHLPQVVPRPKNIGSSWCWWIGKSWKHHVSKEIQIHKNWLLNVCYNTPLLFLFCSHSGLNCIFIYYVLIEWNLKYFPLCLNHTCMHIMNTILQKLSVQ